MSRLFVTGVSTAVGKTVVSAILTKALDAAYWKPFQAGSLDRTDLDCVREWCGKNTKFIHEAARLTTPCSPHAAASIDQVQLFWRSAIQKRSPLPENLVIEGAGGMLVPINDSELIVDICSHLQCEVVLVIRHYLGSINHSLLSLEAIRQRGLKLWGLVVVGERALRSEQAIFAHSGVGVRLHVEHSDLIDAEFIARCAQRFRIESV